jgi:hypothetical protein
MWFEVDQSILRIEGIIPEGRINKMTDLQETKILHLFGLQMCIISVHTPKCNCVYFCVEQHQHYTLA